MALDGAVGPFFVTEVYMYIVAVACFHCPLIVT